MWVCFLVNIYWATRLLSLTQTSLKCNLLRKDNSELIAVVKWCHRENERSKLSRVCFVSRAPSSTNMPLFSCLSPSRERTTIMEKLNDRFPFCSTLVNVSFPSPNLQRCLCHNIVQICSTAAEKSLQTAKGGFSRRFSSPSRYLPGRSFN